MSQKPNVAELKEKLRTIHDELEVLYKAINKAPQGTTVKDKVARQCSLTAACEAHNYVYLAIRSLGAVKY